MIRSRLETSLNRTWYGNKPPGFLLRLAESLYALGFRLSQNRARKNIARDLVGLPIVVVGNLTVGGTGKTPLVIRLCELLQSAGLVPGIVSTGYGRDGKDLLVLDGSQPVSLSGDEPRLIHARTGAWVAVGPDRSAAARRLFQLGVDVVLADDGLQRPNFPRQFEICVIDGTRGLGNGHLLPAGPLRETADRLDRVDAVVVNGAGAALDSVSSGIGMELTPGLPTRLKTNEQLDWKSWRDQVRSTPVIAIAGIGNPQRFFSLLDSLEIKHQPRAFPDHHAYTAADFADTGSATIMMTEKDAVKCQALALENAWYLPVSARLPAAWEDSFITRVRNMLEQEKAKS